MGENVYFQNPPFIRVNTPTTLIWMATDMLHFDYRKTSSVSRTKSQSLNGSCILAQLSSLNPLKPGVKLRMKM